MAIGGGPATPMANDFFFFLVWAVGGGWTTPNGHRVASAAPDRLIWAAWPWGWSGHLQRPTNFFFFFFGPLGVAGPPLMGWPATLGFLKIFFNILIFIYF
jgi:hypothetical protein